VDESISSGRFSFPFGIFSLQISVGHPVFTPSRLITNECHKHYILANIFNRLPPISRDYEETKTALYFDSMTPEVAGG